MDFRYNAFISYRHSELDMFVAKKIHKGLETYKVPKAVAKSSGIAKINRVFRDQEELPIGSDLGDNITAAIKSSEFLIVICSPRTPGSEWVQKEISSFISYHGREHILAVLIEGEPGESFPEALLVDDQGNPVEPLAADVRGMNRKEVEKKLKTELLRLSAPILHCNYDDLRQRHKERRNRRIFAITAATLSVLTCLGLGFGLYYAHNAAVLKKALNEKEINHSKFLAYTSQNLLKKGDREAAMLVAREALPYNNKDLPLIPEAQFALSQALHTYDVGEEFSTDRLLYTQSSVKDVYYDESGKYLSATDTSKSIYVWDLETGKNILYVNAYSLENYYTFSPLGVNVIDDKIVVLSSDGMLVYSLDGQEIEKQVRDTYAAFGFLDSKNKLAAYGVDGVMYLYDLSTMEEKWSKDTGYEPYSEYSFSEDGANFAVSCKPQKGSKGGVDLFKTADGSFIHLETEKNYIVKTRFLQNGDYVAISTDEDEIYHVGEELTYYLQCFDRVTGKEKWTTPIKILPDISSKNHTTLISRIYSENVDGIGQENNEVIVTLNSTIDTYDGNTGELKYQAPATFVTNLLISASSSLAYVGKETGEIDVMDLHTGELYSGYTMLLDTNISKIMNKEGRFVTYNKLSNEIILLTMHTGVGLEDLGETGIDNVDKGEASKDCSVVALRDYSNMISFFDAKTASQLSVYEPENGLREATFIDDRTYMILDDDCRAIFIDSRTGESEVLAPTDPDLNAYTYGRIDTVNQKAVVESYSSYCIYDLKNRKVLKEGSTEYKNLIIAYDLANMVLYYGVQDDNTSYRLNIESGEVAEIKCPDENFNFRESSYSMTASPSGKYLVFRCDDMTVKILNSKTYEIEYTIPESMKSASILQFSSDEKQIYLCGDDKLFKIFDLDKNEFVSVSSESYNYIKSVEETADDNMLALYSSMDLTVYDKATSSVIEKAPQCVYFDSKNKYIWSVNMHKLYRFNYLSLKELLEESERQFPEAELSAEQRVKYFVD